MFQSILSIAFLLFSLMAEAALPLDPIQRCLDVRRLADFSARQKMAAKEPGVLRFRFHKIHPSTLPIHDPVGNMDEVIQALKIQLAHCSEHATRLKPLMLAGHSYQAREWCLETNKKMLALAKASSGDFKKYLMSIKSAFDWYQSDGWPEPHAGFKKGEVQFTGYYAPAAIEARSKKTAGFIYPLYRNPGVVNVALESKKFNLKGPLCGHDPLTKMPLGFCMKNPNGRYSQAPDREEIEHGALDSKYIIGYVQDANDPSFLMLQGSGSLSLDGQLFHINYDGANGRPRTMLGRIVQCAQDPSCGGNLKNIEACAKDPKCHDEAKMRCNMSQAIRQSAGSERLIRQFLDHTLSPEQASNLRNRDQSYVFFAKEQGGPYGSENLPLTAHVSCATDHVVIPIGVNFIYHTKNRTSWCIAQDAGGAIKGAHVDVYKGEGHQAGLEANALNHSGSLYVAVPKRQFS